MINIAGLEISVTDDPFGSISLSIFCSGCRHRCVGCQNPELRDFNYGTPMDPVKIERLVSCKVDLIGSVCFLGGDWMCYESELIETAQLIRSKNCNLRLVLYTGDHFEDINNETLTHVDIVIDGEYEREKVSPWKIPASLNQRIFVRVHPHEFIVVEPNVLPINLEG